MSEQPEVLSPTPWRTFFRVAAFMTFLAVVMGSVVCATESGAACPTWPGCYDGRLVPHLEISPLVEFTHRVVAILAGPLVLGAALLVRQLPGRRDRMLRLAPWIALVGAIAAGVFGRLVVLTGLGRWWGVLDLFCALTAMTAMAYLAVGVERRPRRWVRTRLGTLAWSTLAVLLVIHLLGVVVAGAGSYTRCIGWPLYAVIPADGSETTQVLRMVLTAVCVILLAITATTARRGGPWQKHTTVLTLLFAVEIGLGVILRNVGMPAGWAAAYSTVAVALLFTLALLAARAGFEGDATTAQPIASETEPAGRH